MGVPGSSWLRQGSSSTPRNRHLGEGSGQVAPTVPGDLIYVKGSIQSEVGLLLELFQLLSLAGGSLKMVRRGREPGGRVGEEKEVGGLGSDTRGGYWDYHLLRVRLGFLGRALLSKAPLKAVSRWLFSAGQMVSERSPGGWAS